MKRSLDIAFFGSSLVSAYWNGAATYYRGLLRALAARGHRVRFFEPAAYDRQQHRDMADPDWARVIVYPATAAAVSQVLDEAATADVLVKASGVGFGDDLLERGVLAVRRSGSRAVYWDVDAPATLERLDQDPADPLRGLIPQYDLVLTYGGGAPVVRAFQALGAGRCVPIYNGLDPATHHPVDPQDRLAGDLGFLGNRLPDREARVEEFFLRPAKLLAAHRFLLGGNGWADKPLPANVRALGHVYTAEHNAFNCSVRAVLNINRASMARCGFSPPTRVFEAAGAGACLICDAWDGLELFLEPGREVLVATDGEQVARHLRELTDQRARQIGAAARRRVLAEHTYERRAGQVEQLLLELQPDGGDFRTAEMDSRLKAGLQRGTADQWLP